MAKPAKKTARKILACVALALMSVLLVSCIPYDSITRIYTSVSPVSFTQCQQPNADSYYLSSQNSKVMIKIYSSGRLANLGHNHIIVIDQLKGIVCLQQNILQSRVELAFPVNQLVIDDDSDRADAGDPFHKPITDKDIQATRNNLLGDRLLMANQFPGISLIVKKISGNLPELKLETQITVREHRSTHLISAHVTLSGQQISVSGNFSIKQSELGLTPFELFGGAIAVADKMDINFTLLANRAIE